MRKKSEDLELEDRPTKKRCLSLSLSKRRRFSEKTEAELTVLEKWYIPKNKDSSTKWAIKNLTDWYKDFNSREKENRCQIVF